MRRSTKALCPVVDHRLAQSGRKAKTKRSQLVFAVMLFFGLAGLLLALILKLKDPVPPIELLAIPMSQYPNIEWRRTRPRTGTRMNC